MAGADAGCVAPATAEKELQSPIPIFAACQRTVTA